jgi:tetratricopeptide (TPR) repeat protein
MKLTGARKALAAQGSERKFNICDRCFASVGAGQPFCPECGAPMASDEASETSDSAVYTELARANLLRMRGEYKEAEDQCIQILKRFPNNSSANTLLGDISAEQNDLAQAAEWYELSLDLNPNDDAVKNKLKVIVERITTHEIATTAKQLGIPDNKRNRNLYIAALIGAIILVAVAAFIFGAKVNGPDDKKEKLVTSPVKAPGVATPSGMDGETNSGDIISNASDLPLLKKLESVSPNDASRVIAIYMDPRSNIITICYQAGESYRELGARLAKSIIGIQPDAVSVVLRAMRGGTLLYTADVNRARINDIESSIWQQDNPSANAWIDHVLANEWPSQSPRPTETKATGPNPSPEGASGNTDGQVYESTRTTATPNEAVPSGKEEPKADAR